ncbi:acetylornithine deacetylase/succinyl-diaminopimelate desuccinylase-like protein [Streptomyces sp. SAI-133]|uniref:M20/M25/M40 family metallo-hydrolase n=1 Tax=unclassified Streptomyces TaxID=2593676 RepID=UPI002473200D|nr:MULTISPECIES: M20/M25/M40 family metallo-hydrolase [unclassified Streptomyces]MDH6554926.1 acetylornithine deacetylase/succinyl-diaminopimelate desuccinylase-like protein [Streptomyces sp. SAI-041]MDH6581068.1 acetylornithine deacetylase/succinyl-diaminopimelate desuccinylase-like protein [Streptomyces sp. SAI-133]
MNKGQGDDPVALRDVLAHVAKRQQEYVNRLIDYVSRPSISASGEGVLDVACYIRDRMRDMGLETELIPTAGAPMVLGQWSGSDGPTLLLYGHYDVQPADIADGWVSDPFKPVVRDGRIYGRGTADNKGQHLAQLLAIEAYLSCHERLPCNVKVLLDGEEEIGSPQMPALVAEHGDLLRADLVVISDGPVDPSGRPMISLGVRGALGFELRATGANAELHSGHWGGVAPDPMWDLVQLLATMKDPRGHVTIDGFYDEVQPLSPAGREALERLEIDVSVMKRDLQFDELAEPRERGVAERRVAWPTLTINGLHGGYGGPGLKSVLPREAVAKCDIRLVEAQRADDIFAKVRAHVERHAPHIGVTRMGGSMEPSRTPIDSPFVEPVRRAIVAAQGQEPLLWPGIGGSLPLYVFTKTLGVPTIQVPCGNADQSQHGPNENLTLDWFMAGIRTTVMLLAELAQSAQGRADFGRS